MPIYTDKRNGRLFVQFEYKRQLFKQSLPPGATRTDAQRLETKMRFDAFNQANGLAPKDEILFEDAAQEYLGHIKGRDKYYRAELVLTYAKPFLRGKTLRQIKPSDIERYIYFRQTSPIVYKTKTKLRAAATIWREVAPLSAMFTYFIRDKRCEDNPCKLVEKPVFDNLQDKILPLEDEGAFFAAFDNDTARDICVLVLNLGLSRKDVLSLTDFNISVHDRKLVGTRSKTKQHLGIPINDTAWSIIAPRLKQGLLFVSDRTGNKLTSIRSAINLACRKAGIERVTIRDLRRTYGTRLDTDDVTKSRLLGHSDTRMLTRYVRSTDRMREAVEKLDKPTPNLPATILKAVK